MCLASGRPLQWGAVSFNEHAPMRYKEQLAFLERAHAEGALMYAQTSAMSSAPVFELAEYNGFDAMPHWIDPFVGTPAERMAKLQRPGVRDLMRQEVGTYAGSGGGADAASRTLWVADALAAGSRSWSTRSASSICVEFLYVRNSFHVMLESASRRFADCCGRSAMGREARYGGKSCGCTTTGNVAHHGGSFAFCTQPLGGSTVLGMSSKECSVVHNVDELSPRTTPAQYARSPRDRTGELPP